MKKRGKKKSYVCRICNKRFDNRFSLSAHVGRAHGSYDKEKEREDDPPEDDPKPQPQLLAQPQPVPPPQQYIPQYYYQQVQAQQPPQPQQQNTKKYDPIEIAIGLLSTPTVVEAIKTYLAKNNNDSGEDPIKQLAFQQMIEAWKYEHEFAREYVKKLDEITKEFAIQRAKRVARGKNLPVIIREDDEKEKKLISALVELKKKLDNVTDKFNELLDEEEEEEDGEFV